MRKPILSVLLCLWASAASAEMTGNDLKEYCAFWPRHTESTTLCLGYISGALDSFRMLNKTGVKSAKLFCEPTAATGEQLVAMTQKYLSTNPEQLHFVASSLLLQIMARAFPCPK